MTDGTRAKEKEAAGFGSDSLFYRGIARIATFPRPAGDARIVARGRSVVVHPAQTVSAAPAGGGEAGRKGAGGRR